MGVVTPKNMLLPPATVTLPVHTLPVHVAVTGEIASGDDCSIPTRPLSYGSRETGHR